MPYRYCLLRRFLIASIVLLSPVVATGQQQRLDTLVQAFDDYRVAATTEKIYAHLDQDVCLTGETLWFKIYLVNASSHEPSQLSKVAYVEVLDNVNHAVLQAKIAVNNGMGSGSLFIPASLTSGNYMVRAYTAWMQNFGPEYYFHKKITVINPFRQLEPVKETVRKTGVEFYPEGGQLINGVPTRIAYRLVNPPDSTRSLSIQVVSGDTLASTPDSFGLGSFVLTADAGRQPAAYLTDDRGRRQNLELPKAVDAGYSLRVADTTGQSIALTVRKVNVHDDEPFVYVLIHARNIVSFARVQRIRAGTATVVVPRNALAEGISHITIFDASLRAVCERLYFSPVTRTLSVSASHQQREYGVRRKVVLDLDVRTGQDPAAGANLSVAVYRLDSLRNNQSHILNSIWLDSDLAGVPDLPPDFLVDLTPEKRLVLDHIMLTHGWRRFTWGDVIARKKPLISFIPEMRGHIIRGNVTDRDGNPERGKLTYLSAPGTNIQVYGSISNDQGNVQYEMKDFSGARRVVAQTNLSRDSVSRITIMSPFSDRFAPFILPPFRLSPEIKKTLSARALSMQVQDIYYQDMGAQSRSVAVDTTAFYGKADATYYLDDYTRFPVMEEVMREYVPGVLVRKRRDGFHFINLDVVNKHVFGEDPFIMLDGLPIFDADKIMAFDPLKVKKLEVVNRRYYMGVLSLPGIVSYTTYAGDLAGFTIDPHCVVIDYEGLQWQREHYIPAYENAKQRASRLPDQRDRLYWAPSVITDTKGKQRLEFYTSDITGDYEVLVEGMSHDGKAGSTKTRFVVVNIND